MPRRKPGWVPALTHLKDRGQGRVRFPGLADVYLGKCGEWPANEANAPESILRAYRHEVAQWLLERAIVRPERSSGPFSCADVASGYVKSLFGRSSCPTAERALRPVVDLFGRLPAGQFNAPRFVEVRAAHLSRGMAPRAVNDYMGKVRTAFRWAARPERGWCPAAVAVELSLVRPLIDEDDVPVGPAPPADVEAVLPFLPLVCRAMLELQVLTGMRPGELVRMKPGDLDRGEPCWLYRPEVYKTRRSARVRAQGGRKIWLGPRAQALLVPWLEGKADEAPVFPNRFGGFFGTPGYLMAIRRACKRAGVPRFVPRQVRHTALTAVEAAFGNLDYAQAVAGHSGPEMTRRYAKAQDNLAQEAMKRMG